MEFGEMDTMRKATLTCNFTAATSSSCSSNMDIAQVVTWKVCPCGDIGLYDEIGMHIISTMIMTFFYLKNNLQRLMTVDFILVWMSAYLIECFLNTYHGNIHPPHYSHLPLTS